MTTSKSGFIGFIVGNGGAPTYYKDLDALTASVEFRERRDLFYATYLYKRGGWQPVHPVFNGLSRVVSWRNR